MVEEQVSGVVQQILLTRGTSDFLRMNLFVSTAITSQASLETNYCDSRREERRVNLRRFAP